jgi:hypothetical protein
MLAEIFMVQLEAAARTVRETSTRSTSRFVHFVQGGQFRFKDTGDRRVEPARDEASIQQARAI